MSFPVVMRGRWYPSRAAAAREAGVSAHTLQRHLDRYGHLDLIDNHLPRGGRPDRWKPVMVFGKRFPSVTHAAKEIGVDRKTIRNALGGSASAQNTIFAAMVKRGMDQTTTVNKGDRLWKQTK